MSALLSFNYPMSICRLVLHTAWHKIVAIFPAIRKNKFPHIKITANNFPPE